MAVPVLPVPSLPSATPAEADKFVGVTAAGAVRQFPADASPYTPPATSPAFGVTTTLKTFLDALWTAGAATGAALVRFLQAGTGAVARPLQDKVRESVSVLDFIPAAEHAAIADGTTTYDASADIQKAFDAAALAPAGFEIVFPPGVYLGKNMRVASDTVLSGQGAASVLRLLPSALPTDILLGNALPGGFNDANITIRGLTFDGNDAGAGGAQTRFTELLSFARVTNLVFTGNKVSNVRYIGLALGACRRARIASNEFTACGYGGVSANGGSACWVAATAGLQSEDVVFTGNQVHSNRWHGLHFSVVRGTVCGNNFYDNKEAHLFGSRLLPGIDMSDVAIVGNSFNRVQLQDISAHAIEVGGVRLTIAGNAIYDCDHGGVALTDCTHVSVSGNTIGQFNNLSATLGGGVDVICSAASPNQSQHITITGNTIYDSRVTPLGVAGVYIHNAGGDAPTDLVVENNDVNAAWSSGRAVRFASGMLSPTALVRNNRGNDDTARACTVYATVAQSIPDSTTTVVDFSAALVNSVDMVDGGTAMWVAGAPSRITIKEAGRAKVTASVTFVGNATLVRQILLYKNGAAPAGAFRELVPNATALYSQSVCAASGVFDVQAGDYFQLAAFQSSGGALLTDAGLPSMTWLSVEML